ncbi:MAG: ABC transporter ATP-binding protein [Actinomycetota bacterium]
MLDVDGVDVFYGRVQALRGVSLTVGAGEMVALFGANGAGKTTTLRAISGLVPAVAGRITFEGRSIAHLKAEETAALGIAHIPEGRGVFPRLSVWQNLKMGAYLRRPTASALAAGIDEVLDIFPVLKERLRQPAGTMSGGEQQMLAIARALISKPKLLMLDEPSHGLAPIIVKEVFVLLDRLRTSGMALLIVEQYASAALAVAGRAYVLERGRVVLAGDAETLRKDRAGLAGAYLGT